MTDLSAPPEAALWVPLGSSDDPAVVGGKAASLGRCLAAGLRVPPGGVVTVTAHRRLLAGLLDPGELSAVLRARLAAWPPEQLFAVRSSAEVEDSARASFAGQFRSLLHVPRDEVPAAVRVVQDSVANPSAIRYARRLGVPVPDTLGVITQCQVNARLAGVCFTSDPVTGADDVLVEYAVGIGDAVVGGLALPAGGFRFFRGAVGLAPEQAGEHLDDARRVADLAVRLESMFGCHQDVEWAYEADELWLLQARPITTSNEMR